MTNASHLDIDEEVPHGQVLVCAACGRTAYRLTDFDDPSCMLNSVLCSTEKDEQGRYMAVKVNND